MSENNKASSIPQTSQKNSQQSESTSPIYDKSKVDFTSSGQFKFYPDSPTSQYHQVRLETKEASKFYDPCAESSRMSIKCLEINGRENKKVCNEYFEAYRECKKAWIAQRRRDRMERGGW